MCTFIPSTSLSSEDWWSIFKISMYNSHLCFWSKEVHSEADKERFWGAHEASEANRQRKTLLHLWQREPYWLPLIVHLEKIFYHSTVEGEKRALIQAAALQAVLNTSFLNLPELPPPHTHAPPPPLVPAPGKQSSAPQCDSHSPLDVLKDSSNANNKVITVLHRLPQAFSLPKSLPHWPCTDHNPIGRGLEDQKGGNRLMGAAQWWDVFLSHFI